MARDNQGPVRLYVRKSTLPGAGKGLFTRVPILKGATIIEYKGRIRKWKDIKERDADNGYLLYVTREHVIDAAPVISAIARFANDASGINKVKGIVNNSKYIIDGRRVYIEALKHIEAGNEILVGYGREYWDTVKQNRSLTRLEPAKKNKGK